jgi:hypothetical protein
MCGFLLPLEPSYRTAHRVRLPSRRLNQPHVTPTNMVCRGRRPSERHFYGSTKPFTASPRVRAKRPTSSFFHAATGCCRFLTVTDNHQKARSRPLRLSPSPDAWGELLPSGTTSTGSLRRCADYYPTGRRPLLIPADDFGDCRTPHPIGKSSRRDLRPIAGRNDCKNFGRPKFLTTRAPPAIPPHSRLRKPPSFVGRPHGDCCACPSREVSLTAQRWRPAPGLPPSPAPGQEATSGRGVCLKCRPFAAGRVPRCAGEDDRHHFMLN